MSLHRRTAIMMSRLPRLIDPRAMWLRGLRAALRRVKQLGETLVVADGTAGSEFVRRGAERLEIPIEIVTASDSGATLKRPEDEDSIPERDRILAKTAETILVLGVRTNGNVHRVLRERLMTGGRVELIDFDDLQSRGVREELIGLGAALWPPREADQLPYGMAAIREQVRSREVYEIVPFPSPDEWIFLSHTTRACQGPWPGQSQIEYVDSLLDNTRDADHTAVATLERILTEQRLLASRRTIRGGNPVVCLTAVPLLNLPNRRQFRTHRSRWDFEPFGLCLRRDWLQDQGTRPVVYGDEQTWLGLPEADQPFFQLSHQGNSDIDPTSQPIDWSVEQEWRHEGDLDLRDLPPDQALVFVPRFEAVTRLADVSRWPMTLWPDPLASNMTTVCD